MNKYPLCSFNMFSWQLTNKCFSNCVFSPQKFLNPGNLTQQTFSKPRSTFTIRLYVTEVSPHCKSTEPLHKRIAFHIHSPKGTGFYKTLQTQILRKHQTSSSQSSKSRVRAMITKVCLRIATSDVQKAVRNHNLCRVFTLLCDNQFLNFLNFICFRKNHPQMTFKIYKSKFTFIMDIVKYLTEEN